MPWTRVAGIIGGRGTDSNGAYMGVAPESAFVDIKAIGPDGWGLTNNLIKATDWVVTNKNKYQTYPI